MNPFTRVALAAALSFASTGSFAQATGTASSVVTNFGYTLTDLDPNDDITPQLTWTRMVSESWGRTALQNAGTTPWPTFTGTGFEDRIDMDGSETSFMLDGAAGSTTATTASASFHAGESGASHEARAAQGGYFTLSANTAVTFTADASLTAVGTLVPGTPFPVNTDWAYYSASAGVEIGSWFFGTATTPGEVLPFVPSSPYPFFGMSEGASVGSSSVGGSDQREVQVSVTFRNITAAPGAYNVGVVASAGGYTMAAAAVPEPGTWLLTAIGLASAGWLGRRQARRAAG